MNIYLFKLASILCILHIRFCFYFIITISLYLFNHKILTFSFFLFYLVFVILFCHQTMFLKNRFFFDIISYEFFFIVFSIFFKYLLHFPRVLSVHIFCVMFYILFYLFFFSLIFHKYV